MTKRIFVRLATMREAADDFQSALDHYTAELQSLEDDLKKHLHEWTGEARSAFDAFHAEWHRSARDMADALGGLRRRIVRAHGNYHSAHRANQLTWRRR